MTFFTKFSPRNWPWGFFFAATLLFTREANVTRFLTGTGTSNYVDVILSPAWLLLLGYVVYRSSKLNTNWLGLLMTWNLLVAFPTSRQETFWWLHTWIILLGYLLVTKTTWRRVGWVLLPVFLFDHALLSSAYPVVMLLTFQILRRHKKLRYLHPIVLLHLLTAAYQTATGHALGLHWLGEKYLDLETNGVAKTSLGFWQILRGYGLFAHPIILGIFGLLGLQFFPPCRVRRFAGGLALVSQSRAVWVSLLGYVSRRWLYLLASLLLILFLLRLPTSDSYRFQDLAHYLRYLVNHPRDLLLGTGAGQYAQRLRGYSDLAAFQYQPVHSVPLLLLLEIGLGPWLLLGVYRLTKRYRDFLDSLTDK